jgi:hypothetical protein
MYEATLVYARPKAQRRRLEVVPPPADASLVESIAGKRVSAVERLFKRRAPAECTFPAANAFAPAAAPHVDADAAAAQDAEAEEDDAGLMVFVEGGGVPVRSAWSEKPLPDELEQIEALDDLWWDAAEAEPASELALHRRLLDSRLRRMREAAAAGFDDGDLVTDDFYGGHHAARRGGGGRGVHFAVDGCDEDNTDGEDDDVDMDDPLAMFGASIPKRLRNDSAAAATQMSKALTAMGVKPRASVRARLNRTGDARLRKSYGARAVIAYAGDEYDSNEEDAPHCDYGDSSENDEDDLDMLDGGASDSDGASESDGSSGNNFRAPRRGSGLPGNGGIGKARKRMSSASATLSKTDYVSGAIPSSAMRASSRYCGEDAAGDAVAAPFTAAAAADGGDGAIRIVERRRPGRPHRFRDATALTGAIDLSSTASDAEVEEGDVSDDEEAAMEATYAAAYARPNCTAHATAGADPDDDAAADVAARAIMGDSAMAAARAAMGLPPAPHYGRSLASAQQRHGPPRAPPGDDDTGLLMDAEGNVYAATWGDDEEELLVNNNAMPFF